MAAPPPPSSLYDDLRSCGTVVLVLIVMCILLANVAVTAPATGCLNCGPLPPVPPPILTLVQTSPLLILTLLVSSVIVAAVGIYAGRMTRRVLPVPLVYLLQICPLITVGILGLVALFLHLP